MNLLKLLPPLFKALGNHLAVLHHRFERAEQMPPLPALKEDRLLGEGSSEDLIVIDPAKVRSIEVTVGNLKLSAVSWSSSFYLRPRDLFMGGHSSQEFTPALELYQH